MRFVSALALLVLALPLGGAARGDDLAPDEVERLTAELEPWLARLGRVLAGEAAPAELGANLVFAGTEVPVHGAASAALAARVRSDEAWLGIGVELVGDGALHVKSKVVGVDTLGEGRACFEVRSELVRRAAGEAAATAQATLHIALDAELGPDGPLPRRVGLLFAEVAVRASAEPLLVERTLGLFADDPESARVLGLGLDRWAQRLDDPGLTAWFGHQGLAAGDVTGDGRVDLYVGMPSGIPNMLLVQQPDGTVIDEAERYGLAWLDDTKGVILDDLDGDGRIDVASALGHVIVVQTADRRVPEGVDPPDALPVFGWCVAPDEAPFYSIASADLDGDGFHEIFGARYVTTRYVDSIPIPFDEARNGPENCLFRFDGQRYRDVAREAGLVDGEGGRFSLAASFVDVDGDGREDLYVVNDFGRNQLFLRGEGLRFREAAAEWGIDDPGAGMGASWADADGDGRLDLYVTNMFSSAGQRVAFRQGFGEGLIPERVEGARRLTEGSALYLARGERYERQAGPGAPTMGRWGWGGIFVDLDLDGCTDIVAPAGFLTGPEPGDL